MLTQAPRELCPNCHKPPEGWQEKPAYGSRQIYWLGCKKHGILAGGVSQAIAVQNWNRTVSQDRHRWRYR